MQPRLKTSKKWTSFPKEYVEQIQAVFYENFLEPLAGNKLIVEGRIYPSEVLLRVGVNKQGQLRQANFEVSMDYNPQEKDAVERIHNCIDAAASMMTDYFELEDEVDLPRTWQEYPFQGKSVFLQFSTENSDLEAQANALLGENAEALVLEEESEDALAHAEVDPILSEDLEEELPEDKDEDEEE
ncbi:MAG: hypothetical protein ACXVB1_04595, partial [Pseudobdellovibrionaceae bacterium]